MLLFRPKSRIVACASHGSQQKHSFDDDDTYSKGRHFFIHVCRETSSMNTATPQRLCTGLFTNTYLITAANNSKRKIHDRSFNLARGVSSAMKMLFLSP
jgi:hypothetical protein